MSTTRFKVGDKVKVREGLVADEYYGDVRCSGLMARMGGEVLTINHVTSRYYGVNEYNFCWSDEMLEPAEKTLDNLCAGDMVRDACGTRKVLVAINGCYLLSWYNNYDGAAYWFTAADLEKYDYKPVETKDAKALIEINGKKYNKSEVEEAIEDLEPIE